MPEHTELGVVASFVHAEHVLQKLDNLDCHFHQLTLVVVHHAPRAAEPARVRLLRIMPVRKADVSVALDRAIWFKPLNYVDGL